MVTNEEYSKEQIEEYADGLLKDHKTETKAGKPFSFSISLGKKKYQVFYEKKDEDVWKLQDFKETS
ncbi:hypothetical protein GCM10023231_25250 [Olivibacter ginsenosidimutans]|uniref:Lipoprotein n=1 Tax=Olivibacter ginsenosidimutans TaxID=1176537 RepID=A0ABP9BKK2_9SPHI